MEKMKNGSLCLALALSALCVPGASQGATHRTSITETVTRQGTETAINDCIQQTQQDNKKLSTGRVLDSNGEPVIGATVVQKGGTARTVTDVNGNYSLPVPSGTELTITYIGCIDQTVTAGTDVVSTLKDNAENLNEVVVVGYGVQKKNDLTGSLTVVKPDELTKGVQTSAQDALLGKIAGVNVVTAGGAPGSGATIRIRSGASLSASNDPLIVIDGVPVDNSSIAGASNLIGSLNPNDIESFTVLKDASATAIYGSRASNGVIVITTKKGSEGKPKINYSSSYSVSSTAKRLDVLSASEFRNFVPTVTGVPKDVQFGTANTDWQDEIYRTAFGTDQNVSVSGSAIHAVPYRVSAGYTNQSGIIKTNKYQRCTFDGSIAPEFLDKHLSVNVNLKYSFEDNDLVDGSVVGNAMRYDPTRPVHTGSATASTDAGLGYFIWMNGNAPMAIQTDNPVAQLDLQDINNTISRTIGNIAVSYKIHGFEDLKLNANYGFDLLESKYKKDVPSLAGMMYTSNIKDGTGLDYDSKQKKHNTLLDLYANYHHLFSSKHDFSFMAGYGWQHFWKKFNDTSLSPEGKELFTPAHSETEYYLLSLYGRANYTFDNRYLLTATLRADASSRFSKDNRWGYFPSVALGWRISQEKFMQSAKWLSNLKLRLSYGVTGQQDILNDYPYMTTFSVSYPESSYRFGDKWYRTYRPNGYDADIKWEETSTWNGGLDWGVLDGRLSGSIDVYKRYTKNLLNTINVLAGTNYAAVLTTNIGKMENEGVELSLNAIPVKTADLQWDLGMNVTWNNSKITKLNPVDTESNFVQTGYISGTGKFVQCFMVGKRPYTYYLAKQAYGDDGKPLYGKYVQPDGTVSETETREATSKSALPKAFVGFNTHLQYRNWDLGIAGHGAFGAYVYNFVRANEYTESVYSDQGNMSNILRSTRDLGFADQQLYSDYFLEKADFFRIDNITLGYTFRKLWNNASNLRLAFSVQNVCTITGYDGVDPEISSGIDQNAYPRPRVFSLSASLNF